MMYKTIIALLFVYGIGHMAYTFFEYDHIDDKALWFFSGGLLLLATACINLLNLALAERLTRRVAVGMNVLMLVFCIVLSFYIPEVQVYILIGIQAAAVYCAVVTRTRLTG